MSLVTPNPIAVAVSKLATRVLPQPMRHWGIAMHYEVKAIEQADKALIFAFGCLIFALRQFFIFHLLRLAQAMLGATSQTSQELIEMNIRRALFERPARMAALCVILATGLGLVYMMLADAPVGYLVSNISALVLGFLAVGVVSLGARFHQLGAGVISCTLAAILLLTSMFGSSLDGATRWISAGGLFVQSSLLILPVMAILFARVRNVPSTAGIMLAALALATQPDRGMSAALATGMIALVALKPERNVMIATSAALCGFVATMLQPDVLPAVPYVDQILYSSFDVHPLAGLAVLAGAALLIVPAVVGLFSDSENRGIWAVFAAVWIAIIIAAALGNYPTPIVGYGGSAIIGYVVCLLGLPKRINGGVPASTIEGDDQAETERPYEMRIELGRA